MPNNMIIEPSELRKLALKLLEKDYIPIFGEFNDPLEEIVQECIVKATVEGKKKVTFLINSGGGNTRTFAAMKGVMLESGIEFKGLVTGRACSNAFNLLQQCKNRVATRDALLMFHWGTYPLDNQELATLIAGEIWPIELAKKSKTLWLEQVSQRTGVAQATLIEFALHERGFYGEEALAINFLDEVVKDLPAQVYETLKNAVSKE